MSILSNLALPLDGIVIISLASGINGIIEMATAVDINSAMKQGIGSKFFSLSGFTDGLMIIY